MQLERQAIVEAVRHSPHMLCNAFSYCAGIKLLDEACTLKLVCLTTKILNCCVCENWLIQEDERHKMEERHKQAEYG